MYDFVRWTLLALIFLGLLWFYAWTWYRNNGKTLMTGKPIEEGFKVLQKRSIDYRTGVCLIESYGEAYLLAYTSDGGVSWQHLGAAKQKAAAISEASNSAKRDESFSEVHHAANGRITI